MENKQLMPIRRLLRHPIIFNEIFRCFTHLYFPSLRFKGCQKKKNNKIIIKKRSSFRVSTAVALVFLAAQIYKGQVYSSQSIQMNLLFNLKLGRLFLETN